MENKPVEEKSRGEQPGKWGWFLILFPPFLILPLVWINEGSANGLLIFMVGGIAALVSLFRLFIVVVKWSVARLRKKPFPKQYEQIRAALTLILFILVIGIHEYCEKQVAQEVLEIANQIQMACDSKHGCFFPQSVLEKVVVDRKMFENSVRFLPIPAGAWLMLEMDRSILENSDEFLMISHTTIGPRYLIVASIMPDNKDFNVTVMYDITSGFSASGGIDKELTGQPILID